MQMHMTTPHDIGLEQVQPNGDGAMFNIKTAGRADESLKITDGHMRIVEEESEMSGDSGTEEPDAEEDRLDRELDALYENYQRRREERDAKERAKKARKQKETDEWGGLSGSDDNGGEATTDGESDFKSSFPLRPPPSGEGLSSKAAMFFDQDFFKDLGISDHGLVICSVAILTKRRPFWYGGIALGVVGAVLGLVGLVL